MQQDNDKIAELLKHTPPISPRETAKEQAILQAMEAYDKKYSPSRQGIAFGRRLMGTAQAVIETLFGEMTMKKTYAIAGSCCVLLLATTVLYNTDSTRFISKPTELGVVKNNAAIELKADMAEADKSVASPITSAPAPEIAMQAADAAISSESLAPQTAMMEQARSTAKIANFAPGGAPAMMIAPADMSPQMYHDEGRDKFKDITPNPLKVALEQPVSTFSVDVDTASYSFMRSSLNNNALPQKDSIRIEELINYFPYHYQAPEDKAEPFKASVSVFPTPWNAKTKLMHIGIKGFEMQKKEKPHANLVFLLDTSGSMNEPNKLPLLQNSLKLLLTSMNPDDTIAIVTYAGSAGTVLEPTAAKEKSKILSALDNLYAGGSTAGAEGIRQAYQLAEDNFDKKGINRVILATDGDFNVGITDTEELKSFIERKRDSGVFLSVLGFGRGNYNDELMQVLAQNGNGNASYIDNLNEARKVLVEEAGSTLFPIAKDVKIQVEFNPERIAEYRLIGYETRILNREDFNNDKVDAGDIGAGHTVTAIYEVTPTDSDAKMIDDLRYGAKEKAPKTKAKSGEYAFVKIRYKLPNEDKSKLITTPVDGKLETAKLDNVPVDARFATSVAAFGQILRGDSYTGHYSYDDVIALAEAAKGKDSFCYRSEFINLVRLAKTASALQPLNQ